jgi:hypothetical protein
MTQPAAAQNPPLVAGRSCGDCHVCCYALRIDEPYMQKPAGAVCKFLDGQGCTIYEQRFPTCRSWLCGWWFQPELGDQWRPDLCGVLLVPEMAPTPGFQAMGYKVQLASQAPLASPEVLNKLCGFIAGATPIYLSLEGHHTKAFLNPVLSPLIAAGDGPAILAALMRLVRELAAPQSGHGAVTRNFPQT